MTNLTAGLLAAIMVGAGTLVAQSQSDPETLKLLRQTLADQKRNPDKVIRNYTNLPPAEVTSPAPAREAAPQTVAQSKPPEQSKPAPPPAVPSADKKAAAAELERQFLNGKLSARQYQKALAELENPSKPATGQATPVSKPAPAPTPPKGSSGPVVVAPATPTPAPQPAANQKRVSEVEARIEEIIRQKEARELAAKTNSVPVPGVKSSKRERLDFLLRQVVEGKLSDAEYKKEREKILAEPE
jgi:hypothetical protein